MSVQATTWVWEYSRAENAGLLVMLAIADSANREGAAAMQSISTIAKMCRISDRHVARCIARLLEMGELEKTGMSQRYGTSVYRLPGMGADPNYPTPDLEVTPDKPSPPDIGERAPLTSGASTPDLGDTQPQEATPGRTTPSSSGDDGGLEAPAPELAGEPLSTEDELFEDFWHHYPKKVSRKDARTAFGKALKATDYLTLQTGLVSAIKAWKVDGKVVIEGSGEALKVKVASGEAGKGVPHAATWLNGERWNDEYPDAKSATGQSGEDPNAWMHRTD